jgi:hypothetical protein
MSTCNLVGLGNNRISTAYAQNPPQTLVIRVEHAKVRGLLNEVINCRIKVVNLM